MYESTDILILALVAGFIIFKLYGLLGETDEKFMSQEKNRRKVVDIFPIDEIDNEFDIDDNSNDIQGNLDGKAKKAIYEICQIDKHFSEKRFMDGANRAFEIILKAYSEADRTTLKKLLSKEVFTDFCNDLDKRNKEKKLLDKTLVSLVSSNIVDVDLKKKVATISVEFASQQINLIKDNKGKVIDGDPSQIDNLNDIWTFSRNITSKSPIWKLMATKSV